jgi:hypothetical protein
LGATRGLLKLLSEPACNPLPLLVAEGNESQNRAGTQTLFRDRGFDFEDRIFIYEANHFLLERRIGGMEHGECVWQRPVSNVLHRADNFRPLRGRSVLGSGQPFA